MRQVRLGAIESVMIEWEDLTGQRQTGMPLLGSNLELVQHTDGRPRINVTGSSSLPSGSSGQYLRHNGTAWAASAALWADITNKPSTYPPDAHTLDSHSNVNTAGKATNDVLQWNGSQWVAAAGGGSLPSPGTAGNVLRSNGSAWTSAALDWTDIANKPSTFTPSTHTHDWSAITSGKPTTMSGYGITDGLSLTSGDARYPRKESGAPDQTISNDWYFQGTNLQFNSLPIVFVTLGTGATPPTPLGPGHMYIQYS